MKNEGGASGIRAGVGPDAREALETQANIKLLFVANVPVTPDRAGGERPARVVLSFPE